MRKPLNQFYTPQRDPRKHILFVGDIFDSKFSSVLNPIKELLKTDYYCMSNIKHREWQGCLNVLMTLPIS